MRNTVRALVGGAVAALLLVAGGPAWAMVTAHIKRDVSLIIVGVALLIGFNLGVVVMAMLAASDRDKLPEPAPVRLPARRAVWPDAGLPASAAAADRAEHESRAVV